MFPPCSLALGQSMVGVMAVMTTSFKKTPRTIVVSGLMATSSKRAYANKLCLPGLLLPVPLIPQQATADPYFCRRPSNTHREVWLSLLWRSLLLSPESWCTAGFVCALQESLSGMGFDFNMIVTVLLFRCGFSSVFGCGVSFYLVGSNIFLLMVQQLV